MKKLYILLILILFVIAIALQSCSDEKYTARINKELPKLRE